jgi:hypothetical protein
LRYIICRNCGLSYELEEGESIDDFESCNCGGKLYYSEDGLNISKESKKALLDDIISERIYKRKFKQVNSNSKNKSFLSIFILAVVSFGFICIISPRMWRMIGYNFPTNILVVSFLFLSFFLCYIMYYNSDFK